VTGCGLEMGLVPTFSKEFSLQLHSLFWFKGCPARYPVGAVVFFCGVKVAGECSKHSVLWLDFVRLQTAAYYSNTMLHFDCPLDISSVEASK